LAVFVDSRSAMPQYLSKSDYKTARSCPTKLYYRKLRYPSGMDDDPYLEMLADGGYMIEEMARQLHPDAVAISDDASPEEAARLTLAALARPDVSIFQPTFIAGALLARMDILVKRGNDITIIEVKAKSYDSVAVRDLVTRERRPWRDAFTKGSGEVAGDWREYVEDLAFQAEVLQRAIGGAAPKAKFYFPDKSKRTGIDGLLRQFALSRVSRGEGRGERVEARFQGDAEALRNDHVLALVDATEAVRLVQGDVASLADDFASLVRPQLVRRQEPVSFDCGKCEYRLPAAITPNGFLECWGARGEVTPSLLDLVAFGTVQRQKVRVADALIEAGKISLFDVPEEALRTAEGAVGGNNRRQLLQIRHSRSGVPWVGPGLAGALRHVTYPLHFIDFETSDLAVPYHAGMRPYERVAFQWSCHTIDAPHGTPRHSEWINVEDEFPNLAFLTSLRDTLGSTGTVLTWSQHERTTLMIVRDQIERRALPAQEALGWLVQLIGLEQGDLKLPGRMLDQYKLCLEHFYHPRMGGRASIKKVLAAVWETDAALRASFPQYVNASVTEIVSPYDTLPPELIGAELEDVHEGTGAIRAYQRMLYGVERGDVTFRDRYKALLLRYCELDTAAMVMIWQHWESLIL
jgi:hypothetical protein